MKLKRKVCLIAMITVFFSAGNLFAAKKMINAEKKKATSNEQLKKTIRKLEIITERKKMSEGETQRVKASLMNLVNKGVSEPYALKLMKIAIKGQNYNGQEVEEITGMITDCIGENCKANQCVKLCEVCLKNQLQVGEIARVMATVKNTVGKSISPGQIQVMIKDLLGKGVGTWGLTAAIEQVRESVENNFSFRESRRAVTLVVLSSLRKGLKGGELAEQIRKKTQEKLIERLAKRERKRVSEKRDIPSDKEIKQRIRERMRREERLQERREQEITEEAIKEGRKREEE